MTSSEFRTQGLRHRCGFKGPSAAQWLAAKGLPVPGVPNTWAGADSAGDTLLVARLGSSEFFLEDGPGGTVLRDLGPASTGTPPGVYPVLRQDAAFLLSGDASLDVLAQVCNVNFGELELDSNPVIMTMMVGVSVLVIPQLHEGRRQFRIWCDPTFGSYMAESLGTVVAESGGKQV